MVENGGASGGAKCFPTGWHVARKLCDSCDSAAALLFCRKHRAFMCMACDVKLHRHMRHDRVWMCEVCEQAPACFNCKADDAALCVTCDTDIHSANPLARRHERIPVVPFYDSAEDALVNSTAEVKHQSQFRDSVTDGVVPVQTTVPATNFLDVQRVDHQSPGTPYEIDFTRSTTNSNNKSNSQSHNHNVSCSSMEAGVVPEQKSISHPLMVAGETQITKRLSGMDREARVLRYKEKRKKRKFEKKIRYASRKAYAEMRPRIKGRFAKRTESTTELDVDRWLLTAECNTNGYGAEEEYGVFPSF
ncbi:zinc finger protein CONSTANS-LIKE 4 isoform X2 [Cynara cardunculus var. scolymus]|uniref:zinc finger protein CONSTANS-LIKE 4 isoform X2 n=1 Tax=Cynara cardunculus var. scolymus TaxID=59895 RepID=UPI000D62A273|nr:zinc finger protein CONSTANS-LIKE 4 isoform X2 [Cynara cardunculus var. scolymus]